MRLTDKTKAILKDNSGETLVEVTVAFTLLSIMLLIFAQGLAYASRFEAIAADKRNGADKAMINLQENYPSADVVFTPYQDNINTFIGKKVVKVEVDGTQYSYILYRAKT